MTEPRFHDFEVGQAEDGDWYAGCQDRGVELKQWGITKEGACIKLLDLIAQLEEDNV